VPGVAWVSLAVVTTPTSFPFSDKKKEPDILGLNPRKPHFANEKNLNKIRGFFYIHSDYMSILPYYWIFPFWCFTP
jgi:hypothetical protein